MVICVWKAVVDTSSIVMPKTVFVQIGKALFGASHIQMLSLIENVLADTGFNEERS